MNRSLWQSNPYRAGIAILLLAMGLCGIYGAPAIAAGDKKKPPIATTLESLIEKSRVSKDKTKLMGELHDRLAKAEDKESAKLVSKAIEQLQLRSGSDTVDLLMKRAMTSAGKKDLKLAVKLLNAIVSLAPDYAEGWNKRATVYYMMNNYNRSMRDIRRTLALQPNHFGAIAGLGMILRDIGEKEAALKAFRRALKLHPHLRGAKDAVKDLSRDVEGQGI